MTRDELLRRLGQLRVWASRDERAPHKPLLLLHALGRIARGEPREVPFTEVEPVLSKLLRDFGPPRQSQHPEYPFWRLQSDGLWLVRDADRLERRASNSDPKKSELLRLDVHGGLPPDAYEVLRRDPMLLAEAARTLLATSFPESLHDDILSAVGLDLDSVPTAERRQRDPAFRERVLRAYEYRCAVCSFAVRLGDAQVGVEAAHIKWHQAGGPDVESNGLALCALHHKLFDRGAFTLRADLTLQLSAALHGDAPFEQHCLVYHGREIRRAPDPRHRPRGEHIEWHRTQVFRMPARYAETGEQ